VLRPKLGDELFSHYHGRREWTNQFQLCVLNGLLARPGSRWWNGDNGVGGEADTPNGREAMLARALELALEELTGSLGEDMSAWRWGALHHVLLAHPLAMIPEIAQLFTGGVLEIGGDEQTVLATTFEPEDPGHGTVVAPSWRQIQDLSGPDASVGVHTTGQSGNPVSAHWNDQTPLWAAGRYHPLPLSPEAVAEAAVHTLRLLPG
jgi:penicillin amidase